MKENKGQEETNPRRGEWIRQMEGSSVRGSWGMDSPLPIFNSRPEEEEDHLLALHKLPVEMKLAQVLRHHLNNNNNSSSSSNKKVLLHLSLHFQYHHRHHPS